MANCVCRNSDSNCTCDYSPEVVIQNTKTTQSLNDHVVIMHIPYPYQYHNPDGGAYDVGCSGPAVVQTPEADPTHVPHSVQLSCLPGTGTMTVAFASFSLPTVGGTVRPE